MSASLSGTLSSGWPAPAKLNLFLHINGRRDDGYHELQTLFQFLDYADVLDFKVTDQSEIRLHSTLSDSVPDSDNLIVRAARALQAYTQFQGGAEIWLDKKLPMGGGLGGGSSDAATTLVALNQLWNTQLSDAQLAEIGLTLGADVPIFIYSQAAFAQGVGEDFQPVNPATPWYLVIAPNVHISTAAVFQDPCLPRDTPKLAMSTLMQQTWRNDCQELVASKVSQVAKALDWLLEYAPARMTGTGACVFGAFAQQQQALAVLAKLSPDMPGFVAQGLNVSPLNIRRNTP